MSESTTNAESPNAETLLTTAQLASFLRNRGAACRSNRETITRWILRGVEVAGQRVRLQATRQGGMWVIRWGDYLAFQTALTARAAGAGQSVVTPTDRQRRAKQTLARAMAIFAGAGAVKRETSKTVTTKTHTKRAA